MNLASIGVIGAGTMGNGIAQVSAAAGLQVVMVDVSDAALSRGLDAIAGSLERLVKKDKLKPADRDALMARVRTTTEYGQLSSADLVIEAATENLEIKRKLLERVDAVRKPGTIVTSNTSGLPIRLIAEGRSEDFQRHWAGSHFFNPPRYLKLAELIPGPKTLPAVLEAL